MRIVNIIPDLAVIWKQCNGRSWHNNNYFHIPSLFEIKKHKCTKVRNPRSLHQVTWCMRYLQVSKNTTLNLKETHQNRVWFINEYLSCLYTLTIVQYSLVPSRLGTRLSTYVRTWCDNKIRITTPISNIEALGCSV